MSAPDDPMTCAMCGNSYPWKDDYWPGRKLWAICWHCHVKQLLSDHRHAIVKANVNWTLVAVCAFCVGLCVALVLR